MANSADPDQLIFLEANLSASALFAKAGYTRVQQEKGSVWSLLSKTIPYRIYCNCIFTANIIHVVVAFALNSFSPDYDFLVSNLKLSKARQTSR